MAQPSATLINEELVDNGNVRTEDQDPYRTAFHFQPPNNWMNDPNGPMVYKGIYHFFYQQYPTKPTWNIGIVWGHSTSTDLINWTPQPIALAPSQPYDSEGCWSGSTTILPGNCNRPAILYTGGDKQKNQTQNLAFPKDLSDPYLKEWVKVPQNPILVDETNPESFRDPSTAWFLPNGRWRMIVGTKDGERGVAALFTSNNFVTWTESDHPLHSAEGNGMWECPEMFPVYIGSSLGADWSVIGPNVKHVLKVSLWKTGKTEYYTIGTYDTVKDIYVPDEGSIENDSGLRCDYGLYYASKSFFDGTTNRRIIWGWVKESCSQEDDIKKGWSGLQAIPRTIVLDQDGKQLVQWPVTEIETLRQNRVDWPSQIIKGGSRIEVSGITASQADIEISFKIPELKNVEEWDPSWTDPQELISTKGASTQGGLGPFGLLTLASTGLEEYTAVFFRIFKGPEDKYVVLMGNDLTKSSLNSTTVKTNYGTIVNVDPTKDELTLRILIDHSIIESYGAKGKNCITARVYPTMAINEKAHLYAFNYGTEDVRITSLSAWSMKKAEVNSTSKSMRTSTTTLTTPMKTWLRIFGCFEFLKCCWN